MLIIWSLNPIGRDLQSTAKHQVRILFSLKIEFLFWWMELQLWSIWPWYLAGVTSEGRRHSKNFALDVLLFISCVIVYLSLSHVLLFISAVVYVYAAAAAAQAPASTVQTCYYIKFTLSYLYFDRLASLTQSMIRVFILPLFVALKWVKSV